MLHPLKTPELMRTILFVVASEIGHLNASFSLARKIRIEDRKIKFLCSNKFADNIRNEGFEPIICDYFDSFLPEGVPQKFKHRLELVFKCFYTRRIRQEDFIKKKI